MQQAKERKGTLFLPIDVALSTAEGPAAWCPTPVFVGRAGFIFVAVVVGGTVITR